MLCRTEPFSIFAFRLYCHHKGGPDGVHLALLKLPHHGVVLRLPFCRCGPHGVQGVEYSVKVDCICSRGPSCCGECRMALFVHGGYCTGLLLMWLLYHSPRPPLLVRNPPWRMWWEWQGRRAQRISHSASLTPLRMPCIPGDGGYVCHKP